eukprot:4957352-Pyramimonas_sp.AAC.1
MNHIINIIITGTPSAAATSSSTSPPSSGHHNYRHHHTATCRHLWVCMWPHLLAKVLEGMQALFERLTHDLA